MDMREERKGYRREEKRLQKLYQYFETPEKIKDLRRIADYGLFPENLKEYINTIQILCNCMLTKILLEELDKRLLEQEYKK
jgi:hypothetical protein